MLTEGPSIAAVKATLVTLHLTCSHFREANSILIFFTSGVSVTESVARLPALHNEDGGGGHVAC